MSLLVRPYQKSDYENVISLYKQGDLYGGQFDENRDAKERLQKRIENDPDAVLVAQENGEIVGTVSLIEDGRVAWLFRFCIVEKENTDKVAQLLFEKAKETLQKKGHKQVLVYAPVGNESLCQRYQNLGFTKGNDYTCYWKNM